MIFHCFPLAVKSTWYLSAPSISEGLGCNCVAHLEQFPQSVNRWGTETRTRFASVDEMLPRKRPAKQSAHNR